MTWVKLDDGFWSNPKVLQVGNEAAGVYARMLSYCGCHGTDGGVPEEIADFIGSSKCQKRLLDAGLIERLANGFVVPDYLEFNPSRDEVEQRRQARSEAGRLGGLAKARASAKANGKANG